MRRIPALEFDDSAVDEVTRTLRSGGIVCFPTDTAYGLGVDSSNAVAVDRLFALKGRPPDKPILVLVDSMAMARRETWPDPVLDRVAAALWPGPITLVTRAGPHVVPGLTAGTGTIGLRWPDAPLPLRIVGALGRPVTATSANRSGQPVAAAPEDIVAQLGDGLDLLIDGGPAAEGVLSTVLDLVAEPPVVVREGAVPFQTLAELLGVRLVRGAT